MQPWLVFAAVALALGAVGVAVWTRRPAPVLFALGAAAFFASGARPRVTQSDTPVVHALVVDVSASMRSRGIDAFVRAIEESELPASHSFRRFELSDALRAPGGVRGRDTAYARLGDMVGASSINGEVLLITDGQGQLDELQTAVSPARLILIRPPAPEYPDAAVLSVEAPTTLPAGTDFSISATIACDRAADIPWTLLRDGKEAASGTASARAGAPRTIVYAMEGTEASMLTVTLRLDLPDDREPGNDEGTTRIFVGGKRRIEYCVPDGFPREADAMLQMLLADERNDVQVRHDLPRGKASFRGTGAMFINNLSLSDSGATGDDLRELGDWVKDGGSVVMLGTHGAFGPGGYRGTPLEDVMPVRFRPDDAPPRRTLLLLDVSQSMGDALPGGETRLQRLKSAARQFIAALGDDDLGAVVGFREALTGPVEFHAAGGDVLTDAVQSLWADGSTHIGSSLSAALQAVPPETRILMITDGDDVEGAGDDVFRVIADRAQSSKVQLDIVLTAEADKPWLSALMGHGGDSVRKWHVGADGFDALLETLDRALAGADREWILDSPMEVAGVESPLPRLVRTSQRDERSVAVPYRVAGEGNYPVVAKRGIVGRSLAICTDSWGDEAMVRFWQDLQFALQSEIDWVLENANAVKVVLNRIDEGAELIWTGEGDAPLGDLATDAGVARLDEPGRWLLEEFPGGESLRVYFSDRLLQNIPLPSPVARELRYTGDDAAFFAQAESAGIRVFSGLAAWAPRRFETARSEPLDVTWVPALLAVLLLLLGFALRRR